MMDASTATENLKVIRRLMERATIYRAISAPTAIAGGFIALFTAGFTWLWPLREAWPFVLTWVLAFALAFLFNLALLWREARSRGAEFPSPGMFLALKAVAPAFLVGAIVPPCIAVQMHHLALCAALWILLYGIGILGTSSFAPQSMKILGMCFIIGGVLSVPLVLGLRDARVDFEWAAWLMGIFFGGLHLVYGTMILWRQR